MLEAVGQLIAAIAAADLIVGVGHWLEDRYCGPTIAGPGPRRDDAFGGICAGNAWHHADPLKMSASAWKRNALPLVFAAAFAVALYLVGWLTWQAWIALALIGCSAELHYWHHAPAPQAIRLLHAMGILQTPQQHARHHRGDQDTHFCTVTNWLNPLLDGSGAWRRLEGVVALAGIRPRPTELVTPDDDDEDQAVDREIYGMAAGDRWANVPKRQRRRLRFRVEQLAAAGDGAGIRGERALATYVIGEYRGHAEYGSLAVILGIAALSAVIQFFVKRWLERHYPPQPAS